MSQFIIMFIGSFIGSCITSYLMIKYNIAERHLKWIKNRFHTENK